MLRSMFIALAVLGLAACGGGAKSPGNGEVKKIIENELTRQTTRRILLGDMIVTTGATDLDKREISADEFKEVQAWEKLGLVTVSAVDITFQNRGDLPFSAQKKITVTATDAGKKLSKQAKVDKPEDRFLYGRFFEPHVKSVIENREVKKDVDLYRVVKGSYENKVTELGERFYLIMDQELLKQAKMVALLKWDAFEKKWTLVALDTAKPDRDIATNNVGAMLAGR